MNDKRSPKNQLNIFYSGFRSIAFLTSFDDGRSIIFFSLLVEQKYPAK